MDARVLAACLRVQLVDVRARHVDHGFREVLEDLAALAQTSESSPYTLEIGEGFEMSTSFKNQGMGNFGPDGAVEGAYARAYVNDMSGNKVWSESKPLESLDMAYYENGETFEFGFSY